MTPTPASVSSGRPSMQRQESSTSSFRVRNVARKEGHLYKKRAFPRMWQARYFALENGTLYYYKREGDAVPEGVVVLAGCTIRMTKDKKLYSFRISHPNSSKVYDLGTGTETKAKEWVHALLEAAQAVEEQLGVLPHMDSSDELASSFLSSSGFSVGLLEESLAKDDGVQVPNQYHDQIQAMLAEFLYETKETNEDWKFHGEERNVKTFLPRKPSRFGVSKGVGVVNHSPFAILDLILRVNKRKTFDHQLLSVDRVEVFDDHTFIDHLTYKPVFPAKGRDFVNLTHWRVLKDGSILVAAQSVKQSDSCPATSSDIVRAETRLGGFLIVPNGDYTAATVTYLVKVSLKGEIPAMIEKQVFRKQALMIDEMRNVLEDNQINELAGVKTRVANDTHFGLTVFTEEPAGEPQERLISQQSSVDDDDDSHSTTDNQEEIPEEGLPCVPEKYKDTIEKLLNRTKSELKDESSWNFHSEKGGVKAYLKIDGSLTAAKGVGHIPFSVRTILDVILDASLKKQYDPQLAFGKRLVELDAHTSIDHLEYNPVFIVAGRDFCNLVHWRILPDQSAVVVCQSVEDLELCPLQEPRVVRGDVHIACWLVKPNTPKGGCDVTFIAKSDLKGSIPSRVASKAASEQPYMISRISEYLKKSPRSKKLDAMPPMKNAIVKDASVQNQPESSTVTTVPESAKKSTAKPVAVEKVVIPEEGLPAVPTKYKSVIEKLLVRTKSELKDESAWNFHSEKHGVKAYLKIDGSLTAAKGVGHIPFSVRTILDVILDVSLKKKYDSQLAAGKRIAELDAQTSIDHLEYKPVFIVAGRDFCNLVHWRILPDQSAVVVCQSVEDLKLCPLQEPRVVRGDVHIACWVVKPNKSKGGCDVTFIVKTDLKGSIPSRVASKAASEQPYMISRISEYLKKSPRSKKLDAMPPMKNTILDAASAEKQAESFAKPEPTPLSVITAPDGNKATNSSTTKGFSPVSSPKVDLQAEGDVIVNNASTKPENSVSDYVKYVVLFYVVSILLKYSPVPGLIQFPLVLLLGAYYALQVHLGPCNMPARRKIMIATFGPPDSGSMLGTLAIDVTKTLEYIKQKREKYGYHLTITHVVMRALGAAFKNTPSINGHLVLGNYYPSQTVDLSCLIAVGGGKDLGVAKISNADKQSMRGICEYLISKSSRLRKGDDKEQEDRNKLVNMLPTFLIRPMLNFFGWLGNAVGIPIPALGIDPFMFGSCLVTSVGMMGLDLAFAPLSAYTQVPMLVTIGAILEKPVVVDGQVAVRPILTITTTIDHRYADGSQCARMAQAVKKFIEDPALLEPVEEETN